MSRRHKITRIIALSFVFLVNTVAFQNCSINTRFSTPSTVSQHSGHGEGYSGKGDFFQNFDPQQPCAQVDRLGKTLPNSEIFFQYKPNTMTKAPYLVRNECREIDPIELNPAETIAAGPDTLIYQGNTFSVFTPSGDFDIVASACPVGKSLIPNAARVNLMSSSLDWTSRSWSLHQGISVGLNGSIQSLPSYLIARNDPANLEGYERASQYIDLQPNTDYAFTFVARGGTVGGATARITRGSSYPNYEGLTVDFDFSTGLSSIRSNVNLPQASVSMVPIGNGYLCSVYFRTSAGGFQSPAEVGVAPMDSNYTAKVGDSIFATAAQLEPITGFCQ